MARIGLIGHGYWGPKLARSMVPETGCVLRTVCDISLDRRAAAASEHPQAMVESDWRRLLGDPQIDAIAIATPANSHGDLTLAALDAGKHVLVEKPMALSSSIATAMIEKARRRNLVLLVDHTYLHSPAIQAIRGMLAEGSLGRIRQYSARRCNAEGGRHDADVLWDLVAHDLAIIEFLFPGAAQAVRIEQPAGGTRHAGGLLSRAELIIHFRDSSTARLRVDWAAGQKQRRIDITGTKARLVFDDLEPVKLRRIDAGGGQAAGEAFPVELEPTQPLDELVRHFAACIRGEELPVGGGHAALRVIRLLEAASASLAGGGGIVAVVGDDDRLALPAE